jgi:hypothetical protein
MSPLASVRQVLRSGYREASVLERTLELIQSRAGPVATLIVGWTVDVGADDGAVSIEMDMLRMIGIFWRYR